MKIIIQVQTKMRFILTALLILSASSCSNDDDAGPDDERRDGQDNRKDKPAIPEHAPIEYICLLYRL